MNKEKLTDKINNYYKKFYISQLHDSDQLLGWENNESRYLRFLALIREVNLNGNTLLDIGCGTGKLVDFLEEHDIDVDYTGVDIMGEAIKAAKLRQPAKTFIHGDIFKENLFPNNSFDTVFASGVFNLNLGNNDFFLLKGIQCMLSLAKETVVFNLLNKRSRNKEDIYFYYDPEKVKKIPDPYVWETEIVDDYLQNDFTIVCRKMAH